MAKLTPRDEKFCWAVVTSRSLHGAYLSVEPSAKRGGAAMYKAQEWANKPQIAERIQEIRNQLMADTGVTVTDILREWADIAFADPNEIVQHRRCNCRNCWGKSHAYQWIDDAEFGKALTDAADRNAKRLEAGMDGSLLEPEPSRRGGFGFDRGRPPNGSCPICVGEGHGEVFVADTNKLTGRASKLYAGVKQTRNGIEVLLRDQDAALRNLALALGVIQTGSNKGKDEPPPDMAQVFNQLVGLLPP